MTGTFDSEIDFWRALGAALQDPEFKDAFIAQLKEMVEDGTDEV